LTACWRGIHFWLQTFERHTLRRQFPTLRSLVKGFLTEVRLQDPTYKNLAILYR
jgi:hypothetical protein